MILPLDDADNECSIPGELGDLRSNSSNSRGRSDGTKINIRLKTSSNTFALSVDTDMSFNHFKVIVGETVGETPDGFDILTGFPPKAIRLTESESISGKISNNEFLRIEKCLNKAAKDITHPKVVPERRFEFLVDESTKLLISSVSKIVSL